MRNIADCALRFLQRICLMVRRTSPTVWLTTDRHPLNPSLVAAFIINKPRNFILPLEMLAILPRTVGMR
jgi:hypothetical protein